MMCFIAVKHSSRQWNVLWRGRYARSEIEAKDMTYAERMPSLVTLHHDPHRQVLHSLAIEFFSRMTAEETIQAVRPVAATSLTDIHEWLQHVTPPKRDHEEGQTGRVPSRRRDRSCYTCGQPGHISRDCRRGQSGPQGGSCFDYDQLGCTPRNCPPPQSRNNGRACYNCGQPGHLSRNCPKPRR